MASISVLRHYWVSLMNGWGTKGTCCSNEFYVITLLFQSKAQGSGKCFCDFAVRKSSYRFLSLYLQVTVCSQRLVPTKSKLDKVVSIKCPKFPSNPRYLTIKFIKRPQFFQMFHCVFQNDRLWKSKKLPHSTRFGSLSPPQKLRHLKRFAPSSRIRLVVCKSKSLAQFACQLKSFALLRVNRPAVKVLTLTIASRCVSTNVFSIYIHHQKWCVKLPTSPSSLVLTSMSSSLIHKFGLSALDDLLKLSSLQDLSLSLRSVVEFEVNKHRCQWDYVVSVH